MIDMSGVTSFTFIVCVIAVCVTTGIVLTDKDFNLTRRMRAEEETKRKLRGDTPRG